VALHPQVRSLLRAMAEEDGPPPADLAAERKEYLDATLRLGGAAEPVAAIEDVVIPAEDGARLPGRVYVPQHAPETDALLVWMHGGGWYVGDIPTFDRVARSLANASGCRVLLAEYRLAPEHRWPAQIRDADAIVAWARGPGAEQLGVSPERILLGGDSAGGQLAVVAARHAGPGALRALLLVYPALDPAMDSAAYREFADGPMLTRADMEKCWDYYLGDADRSDPDVAPLLGDLRGMPMTWVALAEEDPLRDDGWMLAAKLDIAGAPAVLERFDGMVHGFLRWGGVVDGAGECLRWLGAGARAALRELGDD
jgi:acetyl esterase